MKRQTYPQLLILLLLNLSLVTSIFAQKNDFRIYSKTVMDDKIAITISSINYSKATLGTISIQLETMKNEVKLDTTIKVSLTSGISNHPFKFDNYELDTAVISISIYNNENKLLFLEKKEVIKSKPISNPTLTIIENKLYLKNIHSKTNAVILCNSKDEIKTLEVISDSVILNSNELVFSSDTSLLYISINKNKTDTVQFHNGTFSFYKPLKTAHLSTSNDPLPNFTIKGNTRVGYTYFDKELEFNSYNQYPNLNINSSNQLQLFNIPLNVSFLYNSSNRINKNLRSFISISFDHSAYMDQLKKSRQISIDSSMLDLDNKIGLLNSKKASLESARSLMIKNSNNKIMVDTSLLNDYSMPSDSSEFTPKIKLDTTINYEENVNSRDIKKIDSLIQIVDYRINENKNRINQLNELSKKEISIDDHTTSLTRHLSKLEKFKVGNFYEYNTKHSLNGIELIGISSEYNIGRSNTIGLTAGKTNKNFFNTNIKRTNFYNLSISNDHYKLANYKISVSLDQKDKVEENNLIDYNKIFSTSIDGVVTEKISYQTELNYLHQDKINNNLKSFLAYLAEVNLELTNFWKLSIGNEFIGLNYKSKGVFFLQNDYNAYFIKNNFKLFKNKLYAKTNYTLEQRQVSIEEVESKNKNFYFEVGTNFNRYPNIQIIYSPLNYELAQSIDTNIFDISINNNIQIIRVSYYKRIKKTTINTAIVNTTVNNIAFDSDNSKTSVSQSNSQMFISINRPKNNFNFSIGFHDYYRSLQSIGFNIASKISDKSQIQGSSTLYKREELMTYLINASYIYSLNKTMSINSGINLLDRNFGLELGISFRY